MSKTLGVNSEPTHAVRLYNLPVQSKFLQNQKPESAEHRSSSFDNRLQVNFGLHFPYKSDPFSTNIVKLFRSCSEYTGWQGRQFGRQLQYTHEHVYTDISLVLLQRVEAVYLATKAHVGSTYQKSCFSALSSNLRHVHIELSLVFLLQVQPVSLRLNRGTESNLPWLCRIRNFC